MKLSMENTPFIASNPEAEQALLGSVLMDNSLMDSLFAVTPQHFVLSHHGKIFSWIQELRSRGEMANPVTLKRTLEADGSLQEIGGTAYLAQLVAKGSLQPYLAPHYAGELHRQLMLRKLAQVCNEAIRAVENSDSPAEIIAAKMLGQVQSLLTDSAEEEFQNDAEITEKILADINTQHDVTPTGLPKLDDAMEGGLYSGMSYGFAARKKVGKTTLASTISQNLGQRFIKHLFICGEMTPEEVQKRNLARLLEVKPFSFRGDYRKNLDFQKRIAEIHRNSPRCIIYRKAPGMTFDELKRIVAMAKYKHKIQGFILDYWQLVGGKPKGKSTAEHLDEVAQWIADYCRQEGLWSITMAQINQEGNTRGGEGIRLACDQFYQLHREDLSLPNAWLEMLETRYTAWVNVGSKEWPGLRMNENGPHFVEMV